MTRIDFEQRRAHLVEQYLRTPEERRRSTARGVHHVAFICRDAEETIRFYQGVLGFPLVEVLENRDYPGSAHFFLDIGHDNLLAFFDFPGLDLGDPVETVGSLQHLALSVSEEDFEARKAALEARDIAYLGPDRGVDNSIYFKDPNGVQVELLKEPLRQMDGQPLR